MLPKSNKASEVLNEYDKYPNSLLNRSIAADIDRLVFTAKNLNELTEYIWRKYGMPHQTTKTILSR